MKAIITTKYGAPEVLQLQEIEKPTPKDNEVLIKVKAASVTTADTMMRKGSPYIGRIFIGLNKPNIATPGTGFAGVIEAIGQSVKSFNIGDSVFGESIFASGTSAEYLCVSEAGVIATKPSNMSFEEAAPVCDGAVTSMNFLKDLANIQKGHKVLINGASGSLGTAAVQLAKYYGAEVTAVCSTANIELVKSLGADEVIDYTKNDFAKMDNCYDIIYDTIGKSTYSKCKNALTKKGVYMSPVLGMPLLLQMIWTSVFGSKKAKFSATGIRPIPELKSILLEVKGIIESNHLKSVLDKNFKLEHIVDAHSYVGTGHKKGNVVIQF